MVSLQDIMKIGSFTMANLVTAIKSAYFIHPYVDKRLKEPRCNVPGIGWLKTRNAWSVHAHGDAGKCVPLGEFHHFKDALRARLDWDRDHFIGFFRQRLDSIYFDYERTIDGLYYLPTTDVWTAELCVPYADGEAREMYEHIPGKRKPKLPLNLGFWADEADAHKALYDGQTAYKMTRVVRPSTLPRKGPGRPVKQRAGQPNYQKNPVTGIYELVE